MQLRSQLQLADDVKFIQTQLDPYYTGAIDANFGVGSKRALANMRADAERYRAHITGTSNTTPPLAAASREFTDVLFYAAAQQIKALASTRRTVEEIVAIMKAFKEVESGTGWFSDVARIIALDGPGGWLDGVALPKILFEAHKFDRHTKGKYRGTHPNLSSSRWNRSLYIGGAGEWERLWKAMALDRDAALMSASVGTYQILGENYELAGFDNVEDFWDAHMQGGAAAHQKALMDFLINGKHLTAFLAVDGNPENCRGIAHRYNGAGYAANNYHVKIAKAYLKHLG